MIKKILHPIKTYREWKDRTIDPWQSYPLLYPPKIDPKEEDKIGGEYYNELKEVLKESNDKMLNSPCPFNGMKNCTSDCVHFKKGYIKWPERYVEISRCKLWGK